MNAMETPFTNENGESLLLPEIFQQRKVTSVTIGFLHNDGKPDKLTINDKSGIEIDFSQGEESALLLFSKKKDFENVMSQNPDQKTLWVIDSKNMFRPYQLTFCVSNIKKIDWN